MTEVNSVQQQPKSSGFPYGTLVLGGAAGAGVTALTKYGKTTATLQDAMNSANGDTFVKSLTGELDAEKKKQAEILKSEIDKAKTSKGLVTTATTTTGTAAKPISETARKKQILETIKAEVSKYFGDTNATVSANRLLGNKTVEKFEEIDIKKQVEANDKINTEIETLNEKYSANSENLERAKSNLLEQEELKKQAGTKKTVAETEIEKSLKEDYKTAKKEYTDATKKLKDASAGMSDEELQVLKDDLAQK